VGERWTLLVVREAFYGVRRFQEFQEKVGCARNVLSTRLAALVKYGVLDRVAYAETGQRERFEYRLTDKGRALFPVIVSLMEWGDRWATKKGGPVTLLHRDCGEALHLELRCGRGHLVPSVREARAKLRAAR
jgi:DNA-binding HxlR family transcriptional regulator